MTDTTRPEPDRIDGAPHPRDTAHVFGQQAAEEAFLTAFHSGRLHHGWLVTGPRGVGKATLAWRIARFLIATPAAEEDGLFGAPPPPETLDIAVDHPVARRIAAGAEPSLFLLRRGGAGSTENDRDKNFRDGKFSKVIRVEDARPLKSFFALSSADGGRRVVIIDSADEMNPNAANAILKLLEEPPARTVILLISHQPSRLLPTIRSRCRELRLSPLPQDALEQALAQAEIEAPANHAALAELAAGSVGEAVRMITLDGLKLYAELIALIGTLPRFDASRAQALADTAAARGGEDRRVLLHHLIDLALSRLARTGVTGMAPATEAAPGEAEILTRLSPDAFAGRRWAQAAEEIGARLRHGEAVNLDPAALILDTVFKLQSIAGGQAA
ncbi:DNA polymerase III subunit delta' [Pseudooceanicola onchidii]|uniref:DNA polymerase III subunit delta' n=1 Tax=Pseudooceanicola onchidii TaxID=2562279 RepID=UPI0010AAA099|nr:DNA polymerase III subunit delta' [Pseudooceanicola onchidii]